MKENETVHPDYQKGFNEGYVIAKLAPEIADSFNKVQAKSERIDGFKDGRKEFILEKEKDLLPEWLKDDKTPSAINREVNKIKNRNKDLEKE